MSRTIVTAGAHALTPEPTSEDCDRVLAALDALLDLEPTVTVSPEENLRRLAMAFSDEEAPTLPDLGDEITLDALSPLAPPAPFVARITQHPPAPVAVIARSPVSGLRARITPELVKAARELREAEDERRDAASVSPLAVIKGNSQFLVVVGIWAMALSLFAALAIMVTA